jgi:hypothetical protein
MADEREQREFNVRQAFPWTELFRSFQVALDPKKLLLAAAGILAMSFGWWVLAEAFTWLTPEPKAEDYQAASYGDDAAAAQKAYDEALNNWRVFHGVAREGGTLNTWPWKEPRGDNPYKMLTGQGTKPWTDWLINDQFPTLIEPLRKFLTPVLYLLHPETGGWNRFYFLLVTLWTLAVWALFGGAITRMAAVQVARNEKAGMIEALRFVWHRYLSYLSAPVFPLLFVVFVVVMLCVFGLFFMIPFVGDIFVAGLFYPLVFLAGLAMAVVLVGLVGWPLMYTTISTEGSDSFDAISRSYSYVYQNPWHYVWYALVSIAYGAVVMLFVGFMGSLVVYLGKWGLSSTPFMSWAGREPWFLYVHAPESFGWRELLLDGGPPRDEIIQSMTFYNDIGAFMVTGWLFLAFLMVLGFAYSFFWSASTIMYLLMRRKVDDTDLDEVYLEEEDEADFGFSPPSAPAAPAPAGPAVTMVEPPTLKAPAPAAAPAPAPAPTPPDSEPKPEPVAEKPAGGDGT